MATGTTRAQELLGDTKCDLCDTYKNVSWKCQNCNDILCQQCKKSHLRSRVSQNHIVTELEDSMNDGEGSSIFCPDHEDEAFQMFCTTCDILVCLDCISGKHKGHDCKKIKEVVKPKQTQLEDTFKQIKTKQIPKLEQSLVSITNMQEKYNQDIDRVIAEIKTKGDELKQEITSIQDRLIDKLMQQVKEDTKCLNETKEQLDLRLSALKEQLKQHEEKMKKYTDIDIITKAVSIKDSLSQLTSSIEIPTVKSPNFQTGQVNSSDLENMYGQLELEKPPGKMQTERPKPNRSQTNLPDIKLKQDQSTPKDTRVIRGNIVSSFTWRKNLDKIEMTKQNQNEAWMLSCNISTVEFYLDLVNDQGKIITSIKHYLQIQDMATTKSGDLLVTKGSQIMRMSTLGSTDVFADLSPYKTCGGIHVTQNGDVLVGLFNTPKESRIIRLSQQGKTIQVIENTDNCLLGMLDSYITENVNQDIVILCYKTYILVVDKDSRRRFTYGPPSRKTKIKDFHLSDIVCDQSGQILVADTNNSNIHLLDEDGTFLQFILTKQHGIENPKALAIDDRGRIWVGCENGKVFIAE